jgi:hypothetical protein
LKSDVTIVSAVSFVLTNHSQNGEIRKQKIRKNYTCSIFEPWMFITIDIRIVTQCLVANHNDVTHHANVMVEMTTDCSRDCC